MLDGELLSWSRDSDPTHHSNPAPKYEDTGPGYEYRMDYTHYASFDTVKAISSRLARKDPQNKTQIGDVRSQEAFLGFKHMTTPGLCSGHIPGAINLQAAN